MKAIHTLGVYTTLTMATGWAALAPAQLKLVNDYGRLPLRFEANTGQADPRVSFLSRGHGYALFLSPDEAALSLRGSPTPLRMKLRNAQP